MRVELKKRTAKKLKPGDMILATGFAGFKRMVVEHETEKQTKYYAVSTDNMMVAKEFETLEDMYDHYVIGDVVVIPAEELVITDKL